MKISGRRRERIKNFTKKNATKSNAASGRDEGNYFLTDEESRRLSNKEHSDTIWFRKIFGPLVFLFLVIWTSLILRIVFLQGYDYTGFWLSDSTMGILIGTTTANFIALLGIIIKGIFPPNKPSRP